MALQQDGIGRALGTAIGAKLVEMYRGQTEAMAAMEGGSKVDATEYMYDWITGMLEQLGAYRSELQGALEGSVKA